MDKTKIGCRSKIAPTLLSTCCSRIGAGDGRCLDAFIVALNQANDGQLWYTETKQLQIASLEFCVACRSVSTLALIVDKYTPTHLWAGAPARETRSAKRLSATRVPTLRAPPVVWELSASALRHTRGSFSGVKVFFFGDDFNDDVRRVVVANVTGDPSLSFHRRTSSAWGGVAAIAPRADIRGIYQRQLNGRNHLALFPEASHLWRWIRLASNGDGLARFIGVSRPRFNVQSAHR